MGHVERIGNVFYRVRDMDAAVRFYGEVLGLTQKLRDGDHWAAFDINGVTLALEGGEPGGTGGATVSLRVRDLDAFVAELQRQGVVVGAVKVGAHERRADVRDPSGNYLVLYEPRAR